jgi:acyl carrier protein
MKTQEALNWLSEVFEEPAGRISAATNRDESPGWDSLGVLSLIAALDEKFNLQVPEKEIEALQGIEDILAILRRHGALEEA